LLSYKDTGSQICQVKFSKHKNELISTHGFSTNSINIWSSKNLDKIASLQGHT